jgi:hypothetical protein
MGPRWCGVSATGHGGQSEKLRPGCPVVSRLPHPGSLPEERGARYREQNVSHSVARFMKHIRNFCIIAHIDRFNIVSSLKKTTYVIVIDTI